MGKLIVIIQCDDVTKRCSGFFCMQDFYERNGKFSAYPHDEDTCYMTMTCGGCSANFLTPKLENLGRRLSKMGCEKDDVIIHLASCICSENSHRQPCPFIGRIKSLLMRKGFNNIVMGTHVSKNAEAKRQAGIYRKWE